MRAALILLALICLIALSGVNAVAQGFYCRPLTMWEWSPPLEGEVGLGGYRYRFQKRSYECSGQLGSYTTTLAREYYIDLPEHVHLVAFPPDGPTVLFVGERVSAYGLAAALDILETNQISLVLLQGEVQLPSRLNRIDTPMLRVQQVGLDLGTPEPLPGFALLDLLWEFDR